MAKVVNIGVDDQDKRTVVIAATILVARHLKTIEEFRDSKPIRAVALGAQAGSDAGGERAAIIYSLIGSAKLNGLDPEA